jgi:hypothetical protein
MNGITPFNDLMKNIEREEIQREMLKEWYRQRTKEFFNTSPEPLRSRNN